MRLWSIHPKYLDGKGLVALWRESLMAQSVLSGRIKGYQNHPQLERFKACPDPAEAIGGYLMAVYDEACRRGYKFNESKIVRPAGRYSLIPVSVGQIEYEVEHLKRKLAVRDTQRLKQISGLARIEPHPSFTVVEGPVADWERVHGS